MATSKDEPKLTRADIVHGNIALGLLATGFCFALMMGLAAVGDKFFGDPGAIIGAFIGVATLAAICIFLARTEKKMLAELDVNDKHD